MLRTFAGLVAAYGSGYCTLPWGLPSPTTTLEGRGFCRRSSKREVLVKVFENIYKVYKVG